MGRREMSLSVPEPYWQRDGITLYRGDCRAVLAALPADSVSACITSPPYLGLRKYEVEPTIWGGDPLCSHRLEPEATSDAGYAGRKRWQHEGVSRQERPEAWVKEQRAGQSEYSATFTTGGQPKLASPSIESATC